MKRKVSQIGPATLMVSLPSKWVKKYNVKKGDEIEVNEKDDNLVLGIEKKEEKSKISIDLSDLDFTSIKHELRAAYKLGYDEIVLNFDNTKIIEYKVGKEKTVMDAVRTEVNVLIGAEIFEQKEGYCLIKNISESSLEDFDIILRKVFFLLVEISQDLINGAKTLDKNVLESIGEKHDVVTRFLNLCLRLLNKKGYKDYKKANTLYHLIANLDKVLDIIKYSGRDLTFFKQKKLRNETLKVLLEIHNLIENFHKIYYNFNKETINNFSKKRWEIIKDINRVSIKLPENEILLIKNMAYISELLLDLTEVRMGLEM